jgi:hypothetical protein
VHAVLVTASIQLTKSPANEQTDPAKINHPKMLLLQEKKETKHMCFEVSRVACVRKSWTIATEKGQKEQLA